MGCGDFTALNRSTYDRIAARYAQNQDNQRLGSTQSFSMLHESFVARMPTRGLVADLGCGPASDALGLVRNGFRVVAMDISLGMLAVAAERLSGRLAQADLRALPIASGRLDGIWCAAALLHIPEQDTDRVLSEFARTLRPSGVLALVTATGESSRFEEVPYAPDERRWFVYRSADRLREQLRLAGLAVRSESQVLGNRAWLTVLAERV